ncbi:MAG: Dps family protein, partial [Vicinamibacterales bacterium]
SGTKGPETGQRRTVMPGTKQASPAGDVRNLQKELSAENSEKNPVVEQLMRQAANAFVLYANYKRYHWQTFGPHFRDYHKMFDEFAHDVRESLDPLAERIRMIGQNPPSHLNRILDLCSVTSSDEPDANMREMIEEADRNALVVIKEIRQGVTDAEEHDDPGTVDLLSKLVQIYEKQEWWLRDILRGGDGLEGAR